MHLVSEQHLLMSKCILSHVGLLILCDGPNSVADFLKPDTVLYTYFVSPVAFTTSLPTWRYSIHIWSELNWIFNQTYGRWRESPDIARGTAQGAERDCTWSFFLKFRSWKNWKGRHQDSIYWFYSEMENVAYTFLVIMTWVWDTMCWVFLQVPHWALRKIKEAVREGMERGRGRRC